MSNVPTITLNNGVPMPQLGFGVWQVPDDEATAAVATALETGYRSIDTAAIYENERGVGRALAASGLPREELFVTTKLWNAEQGYDSTLRAFDASLERLGLEQVDLYLIHWPMPAVDRYLDTWKAFEKIYADGRARAIGVSNFQPAHLNRVLELGGTTPALNQIELHPTLQQSVPRAYHADHGIATEAWSPLGQGGDLLKDPKLARIAEKHGRTPAQVVLRWHLQLGNVVIPKSVTPSRIRENFDVFGFSLDAEDMAAIGTLNTDTRLGADPDENNWMG
ncbi:MULTISPECIES: aldo/keto reductase [Streptomyces]|uniref:Oxidoreductase n=1 Tax=Streptomyces cacaoi TaxID=1898 RepID=A0A4Y3R5N4_STRCI|nr:MULTISPECIES: aldo/keto reductase [Streptomyces]NNG85775.1 aldo/keto reductase [Streptomyces cacaoi]QHF96145.1 aldo/keto reductase [Streptomyces sp. NHF165]GEB52649.1 oxidoreductase [Streptomyces cacaoi]